LKITDLITLLLPLFFEQFSKCCGILNLLCLVVAITQGHWFFTSSRRIKRRTAESVTVLEIKRSVANIISQFISTFWFNGVQKYFFFTFPPRIHVHEVHPCFFVKAFGWRFTNIATGQLTATRHHPYSANIVYDFQRMIKVILMGLTFYFFHLV
jgi:hypothetical protein